MSTAARSGRLGGASRRTALTAHTGTGTLLRSALRQERRSLLVWVVVLGGLAGYATVALDRVYPTAADRQQRAEVMLSPAAVVFSGPGYGTDDYTLGAMVANELSLTLMLAAAVMSVQLVVRHTRAAEEDGRQELVRSAVVGARAPLTAALALAGLAAAAVALVVTAALVGAGLAAPDAAALGCGIGLVAATFAGVAAVTAQLCTQARAATGSALAVLAAAAAARGIGDTLRLHGSSLSWLSPLAWAQQTRAFVALRWWPLLLLVCAMVGLALLAGRLAGGRDLGAGLLAARPGPATASRSLSGVTGLAVRLQRGTVTGWLVGLALLGATFGALTDSVTGLLSGNPLLARLGSEGGGPQTAFLAIAVLYLALGTTAFAVGSVLRLAAEERAGRWELLLAGPLARARLVAGGLLVTAVALALLLVTGGLTLGLTAAAVTGDVALVGALTGDALVRLPPVLVAAGVAAVVAGWAPRASTSAWAVVSWCALIAVLGPLLQLPGWLQRTSPFGWLPREPGAPMPAVALLVLSAVAAALAALAVAGVRRRDVSA